MANYATLKAAIQQVVKTNGNNEITGALLQQSLLAMINSLGGYYQFAGIATPSTNPGTPDQNIFYLAGPGTYTNFSALVVNDGEFAALKYNGSWTKESVPIPSVDWVSGIAGDLYKFLGKTYTFGSSSYRNMPFNAYLPIGTIIDKSAYPYALYLTDINNNDILVASSVSKYTTNAIIKSFKPTNNENGSIVIYGDINTFDSRVLSLENSVLGLLGVDVSFVNKSYQTIYFDYVIPAGTKLYNNGYSGMIYVYDKNGNQYSWNPANHTYTAAVELVSFKPTTNDSGRITTESKIKVLTDSLTENINETKQIKTDIGLYRCNIWGGQVNFNTGQLYGRAYNGYHFSDPVPIDENTKYVYCTDSNVDRYMFYSDMPVIGENSGIYLGYSTRSTNVIPLGAKYAIVVFAQQYVPATQPFDVYVDKIAYSVLFSKKMDGRKLVTIGDSLTQSCAWQPRLMRYSGMRWSFNECYSGVGYVNINTGTYTTENKSSDPDYRAARPTALYGTPLRPTSENSIYIRSLDVKFYNPEIIFIYGGENDPIGNWVTSGNPGTTPEEIVANETPYLGRSVNNNISAIAAYKGIIENLIADCPNVIIYIVNSMPVYCEIGKTVGGTVRFPDMAAVRQWEKTNRYSRVEYMREIAKYYSLPLVDLWNKAGINDVNASQWYGATGDDATQVHPDAPGYLRMADVMLQCL